MLGSYRRRSLVSGLLDKMVKLGNIGEQDFFADSYGAAFFR